MVLPIFGAWPLPFTGGGGAVSSVFGRVGAVVAALNDYAASQVDNDSGVTGATVKAALDALAAAIPSVPVSSVFGRVGAVVAAVGDYAASQVSNDSGVAGAHVSDALNTLRTPLVLAFSGGFAGAGQLDTSFFATGSYGAFFNDSVGLGSVPAIYSATHACTLSQLSWHSAAADNTTVLQLYVNGAAVRTITLSGAIGTIAFASQAIAQGDEIQLTWHAGTAPHNIGAFAG